MIEISSSKEICSSFYYDDGSSHGKIIQAMDSKLWLLENQLSFNREWVTKEWFFLLLHKRHFISVV